MSNQYLDQFARIKRWHKRLEEIYLGREHDRESDYYQDVVYAFFQNCFHLKDWLIKSGAISEKDINIFIKSNTDMGICRDLCNGSKHLTITKPSIDSKTAVNKREYFMTVGNGPIIIKVHYWIHAGKYLIDAFDLATNCIIQWEILLKKHGLLS